MSNKQQPTPEQTDLELAAHWLQENICGLTETWTAFKPVQSFTTSLAAEFARVREDEAKWHRREVAGPKGTIRCNAIKGILHNQDVRLRRLRSQGQEGK
jgi:hypothetical protein